MQRFSGAPTSPPTGPGPEGEVFAAPPLLREIHQALTVLLATGEETVIDLTSLPLGPGDLARLEETLGPGEVEAAVEAAGPSRIHETGVSGVWMVEHLGGGGEVRARFIEVTLVPALLKADPDDVRDGLATLGFQIEEDDANRR